MKTKSKVLIFVNIYCVLGFLLIYFITERYNLTFGLIGQSNASHWKEQPNLQDYVLTTYPSQSIAATSTTEQLNRQHYDRTSFSSQSIGATSSRSPQNIQPTKDEAVKPSKRPVGFQPVGDENGTFVYSAYYDSRSEPLIHVIVIVKDHLKADNFKCLIKGDNSSETIPSTLEYIPEPNWKYLHRSGIIHCHVGARKPKVISIVDTKNARKTYKPSNALTVQYSNNITREVTRCVPSFHDFKDETALIQMIEYDRNFGTNYFYLYNYTGSAIDKVLNSYAAENDVEILQWDLPVPSSTIHYYGQMAHMHDCLYRNMFVSKFVFFADVDEIVASELHANWNQLTTSVLRKSPQAGAILIRNAFFPTFYKNTAADFPGKLEAEQLNLSLLLKTTRTKIHGSGDRSKLLVRPEAIRFLWIHSVQNFYSKAWTTFSVSFTKEALLHHYRTKVAPDMRPPYAEDKTLHKFSSLIIEKVKTRLKMMGRS